jgi:hypothetical protein
MNKRKANRIEPPTECAVYYSVAIFKLNGDYIAALYNPDNGTVDHVQNKNFNTALTLIINKAHKYYVKETVLFNGTQKISYYGWPPPLSFEFIENFYKKKTAE